MTFDRWYTLSDRVYHLSVVLLVFQLFYLFAGDGCILAIIYCKSSCNLSWAGILQTLHRSSHTSIILTQLQLLAPMGLVWELLQTATPLRSVSRWPWNIVNLWGWPPGVFQTISGIRCASERRQYMNQTSHRRLGICLHISVLRLHRGTVLRCRDDH